MTGRSSRRPALLAMSLGFAVIQLDVTVVNVAVKQIGAALHASVSGLQWTISAYTLMFAALILTAGALGDRLGARRVFTVGFVIFVLASMACGLAPSIGVLIAARAVQGGGAALLGSCSLALLNHTFHEPHEHSRALSIWAAGASMALSGGPVIGGVLIATLGWRSIFFINVPLGGLGLWLTWRDVAETPRSTDRRPDVPGGVAATVALGALAAALIDAGPHGVTAPPVLVGFALFLLAIGGFLAVEARSASPMLPLALFREPRFTRPGLIGLLVNVCFYGLIFLFSLLLQDERGLSALQTGLAFLPMTAAIFVANLVTSKVSGAIGAARAILAGIGAMICACVGLLWLSRGTGYPLLLVEQTVLGGGIGLLVPPMTSTLMTSVDRSRSGVASGTLTTLRQTGSMLGVAVFGSLVAGRVGFYAGLHTAVVISLAALTLAAAVAARR